MESSEIQNQPTAKAVPTSSRRGTGLNKGLYPWLILSITAIGIYCNSLGSWPFIDPGETYYTEAAREMVESGEYIVPHLNYQVYFSKPILNFWLIAGSYKLFGITEWAARIPFGLLATLLVLATYYVTRKIANGKTALLAGLFTASAPLMVLFSKTSSIDLTFTVFLNLAAYAFLLTVFWNTAAWPALWLALALAVLTKGPAGLVLFGIGTALFLLLEKPGLKRLWYWFTSTKPFFGVPLFLLTVIPWYYQVYKATKGLFLQVFFVYENLARFQGKTNIAKSKIFYYFPVAAYGLAPWFLFAPQAFRRLFWKPFSKRWLTGGFKQSFRTTYRPYAAMMQNPAGNAAATSKESYAALKETFAAECQDFELARERSVFFLGCWVIGIFAFFSASKTQLDTYILPLVAPASILLAIALAETAAGKSQLASRESTALDTAIDSEKSAANIAETNRPIEETPEALDMKWDARWFTILSWLTTILTAAAGLGAAYLAGTGLSAPHLNQKLLLGLAAGAGLTGTVAQVLARRAKLFYETILAAALTICALTAGIYPVAFQYMAQGQVEMRALAAHLPDCLEEIALYGAFKPSLIHYLKRPVDTVPSIDQFVVATQPLPRDGLSYGPTPSGKKQLIIGEDRYIIDFARRPDLKLKQLYREGHWAAYELTNGYIERPKSLEECFKWILSTGQSLAASNDYGPLTVPRGGGDADWYKYMSSYHPRSKTK